MSENIIFFFLYKKLSFFGHDRGHFVVVGYELLVWGTGWVMGRFLVIFLVQMPRVLITFIITGFAGLVPLVVIFRAIIACGVLRLRHFFVWKDKNYRSEIKAVLFFVLLIGGISCICYLKIFSIGLLMQFFILLFLGFSDMFLF